jgi:hypothetical protein
MQKKNEGMAEKEIENRNKEDENENPENQKMKRRENKKQTWRSFADVTSCASGRETCRPHHPEE